MLNTRLYKILCKTKKGVKTGNQTNDKTMLFHEHCKQRIPLWEAITMLTSLPYTNDRENKGHCAILKIVWTLFSVISTTRTCESWVLVLYFEQSLHLCFARHNEFLKRMF